MHTIARTALLATILSLTLATPINSATADGRSDTPWQAITPEESKIRVVSRQVVYLRSPCLPLSGRRFCLQEVEVVIDRRNDLGQ